MFALELTANFMTAVCIYLAGRNNIHTWWTGIVGCILFGLLFFNVQLYADVTLQLFFVVTGIIGWLNWNNQTEKLPQYEDGVNFGFYLILALFTTAGYGYVLYKFTNAYAPFIDSLVLSLSILAQYLLMRRKIQTWPLWFIVNTISVPLFFSRELYLTSVMYSLFWINSIISYKHWMELSGFKFSWKGLFTEQK